MVAEPVRIDHAVVAVDLMHDKIRAGATSATAAVAVKEQMLRDGSAWDLFAEQGEWLIYELWRRGRGAPPTVPTPIRSGSGAQPGGRISRPLDEDEEDEPGDFAGGDIDAADSIYQAPFKVDGEWTTLGSMGKQQCRVMQFFFENRAQAATERAKFFKRLADALSDGQKVRKRWSELQLRTMLAESRA